MLPYHVRGSQELADGYAMAAELATERQQNCGDQREAKQWGKISTYCRVMAKYRRIDDMNPRMDYEVPMAPDTLKRLVATQEKQSLEWQDGEFDADSIPPEDPRRPMRAEQRYALAAALRVLGVKERIAAIMFWAWQLDRDLIAETLEMQRSTLDRCLTRAKNKFAKIRADEGYLDAIMSRADALVNRGR